MGITPTSVAAVRVANFAIAKFRDAYGSPLEVIVSRICYLNIVFILSFIKLFHIKKGNPRKKSFAEPLPALAAVFRTMAGFAGAK